MLQIKLEILFLKRGVHENTINWPPKGIHLKLHFKASKADVIINYELFDNVPFLSKWVTVKANQNTKFQIEAIEKISLNWQWSQQGYGWLQIVPDQPHGTKVQWIREVLCTCDSISFVILMYP